MTFLGRILAAGLQINNRALAQAEEELNLAIFQTAYDPKRVQAQIVQARRVALAHETARRRDAQLLAKVASYSVQDHDEEEAFPLPARPTKIPGVSSPWQKKE